MKYDGHIMMRCKETRHRYALKAVLTSRHTKTHIRNKTTPTDISLSKNVSNILNYKKKKQRISNSREIDRFGHSLKQIEAASTMRYRMKKHFRGLSTPVSISPIDSKITQYGWDTCRGVLENVSSSDTAW